MIQSKKRVYELARELNMTNKTLLEKIMVLDLGVNSHMSSLDEDIEAQIRNFIQGKPEPDLEEKRVKPTVIRRRRKSVESDELEAAEESTTADEPADEDMGAPQTEEETQTSQTDEVLTATEAASSETAEAESMVPNEQLAPPPQNAESAETTAAQESPEAAEQGEEEESAVEEETSNTEPATAENETAARATTPKIKKKKKETAAKIIRLPERPVQPPEPPVRKAEPPARRPEPTVRRPEPTTLQPEPPAPVATPEATPGSKEERPKKKGKKKVFPEAEPAVDKRVVKKKVGFHKKEVIEGADLYDRVRGRKGRKGGKAKEVPLPLKTQITTAKQIKRRVKIDETIVLSELAKRMNIKASEMIAKLFGMGVMATVNQTIDYDTAALVAAEFNYEIERAAFEEENILKVTQEQDDPGKLLPRPPVVTIMGHVDHGKTSLLDVIRKSRVTEGEAGGITQHIGAYMVSTDRGKIAFLDTPGHEAFSAMRSRGAHITDIVILVVAADDGVMPQTVEAVSHAKAAKVPIIVAVNKIDKPDAEPERVQRQLADLGIISEKWGGENIFVEVSAKQKIGIDELLELILLQAELLELKANPSKLASGHVVEAKLDAGRGPVATVLVKEGTLTAGDAVVCGVHYGKVRALLDDYGRKVENATPSMPVEIIGLSGVPMAGDEMIALKDEKDAKQVSQHRVQKFRAKELAKTSRLSLDKLYERMKQGQVKDLNLIIKADVDGSLEAIRDSLTKLSNEEVNINIMHSATGTITESDISLAAVSEAIIIGFNVRPNAKVQEMASEENVDIRYHNIIYNVIKEIKDAIVGLMKSTYEERILGRAEVREVFHVPKVGTVAGSHVTDGRIERGQRARLLRDGIVIYDGKAISLRRFKDDVKEVQAGYECGIGLENFNDVKLGDVIEFYYMEEIRPEME
jgi:translation initiation factor IF-2